MRGTTNRTTVTPSRDVLRRSGRMVDTGGMPGEGNDVRCAVWSSESLV